MMNDWVSEGTQVWRDLEFGRLREELEEGVRLPVYQSVFIPTLICGPERRMITKSFLCRLILALEINHLQGAAKSQEHLVVVVFSRAPLKSLHGEVFWAFLSGRRPQTRPDQTWAHLYFSAELGSTLDSRGAGESGCEKECLDLLAEAATSWPGCRRRE